MIKFDGKKIRDEILADLKKKVGSLSHAPKLSILWIGDDRISARYVKQKQLAAEFLGVHFEVVRFPEDASTQEVVDKIRELNGDSSVNGIVVQLPIPKTLDQEKIIAEISKEKDVDALRFCSDLLCTFRPPVAVAILEALKQSEVELKRSKVAVIGRGFLVGSPLIRILEEQGVEVRTADDNTPYLGTITSDADVIISAVGKPGLIKPEIIKNGVVLIDAGTTEVSGELRGDVDERSFQKSAFYTPVPGGIGPVTVAMLYKNLLRKL